ncbi:MAG TPA: hypothetical protein VEA37_07840, partial [Flavobacterium sp.]|nr:hypothetical protein [Flavobacterium sp.]
KDSPKPAAAPPVTPAPTTTYSTTPTEKKYNYSWNYKIANDPYGYEYQGNSCLTEDEMLKKQQLEGAYNIRNWGPC